MTFLFPAMFAGLAALLVPVVLHLIARQRFPIQPIPNLRLIQSERRTNAYAVRPVDLVQLLLRLVVVAAVVFAVLRPATLNSPVGRPARNIVVVLDCSPSMLMSAREGGGSLFDDGRKLAAELIAAAGEHDQVACILAGSAGKDGSAILTPLTGEAAEAGRLVEAAQISYAGRGSIPQAIAQACRLLAGRREILSEVYVLSDMRANVLDGWGDESRSALDAARRGLGDRLRLHFVDLAPGQPANVGILDARLTPGRIGTGADAHLAATVRNASDDEQEVSVNLAVGQTSKARRVVKIPPRTDAIVDLPASFDTPDNSFCRLELGTPDALSVDNSFSVPVRMDRRFDVLIIDGTPPAAPPAAGQPRAAEIPEQASEPQGLSGARVLEFALNPAQFAASVGRASTRNSTVRSISAGAVRTMTASSNLFVLYNVSSLPRQTLDDLQTFVKNGSSVLIIPGDDVSLLDLRSAFCGGGEKSIALCPAEVQDAVPVEPGTRISVGDVVHPVMEPFLDLHKGDLGAIQFAKVRKLVPAPGATVVFTVGGLPGALEMHAAVPGDTPEQQRRRGRICVLAFGLEPGWSNVARTRVFVPLMWRLCDHVAGRLNALPVDAARAGERLVLDCSDFVPSPGVAVLKPDGSPLKGPGGWPLELPLSESGSTVLAGLDEVGTYRVTGQGQVSVELKLADGRTVSGPAFTAAVREAIAGRTWTLGIRSGEAAAFNRHEADGGSFARALRVQGVSVALAGGSTAAGTADAAALDDALAGRSGELAIAGNGPVRRVLSEEVRGGSFADALSFTEPPGAARRSRYVCVNPPAGETETARLPDEALQSALGGSGWDVVAGSKAALTPSSARELWYIIAVGLMLAYFAEGAVGHWFSYRRESTRVQ